MKTFLSARSAWATLPLILLALSFAACEDDDSLTPQSTVLTGSPQSVGDGEAWTEVTLAADGEPNAVWVVMTPGALENLPTGHAHAHEFLLPLPAAAGVPPYDHATLDWNEHGHAPPGVYDVPHFDVHFYFISQAERDFIGPNDTTEFNAPLPAEQLAPMYLETPGGVPRMGAHVIDLESPEVNGSGPFTHTFIYGKYAGELNFLEPMVAESFLRTQPDVSAPLRLPQTFGRPGYFPASYAVHYDAAANVYRVGLTDLTLQ
ncbi:DUF5602 domain-containing protein [Lewinella sp. IMCC34183]|uniref:DUF5602 domain-containing protein n=1 Tax=Lewinella sp. IMCC34183 TaxID=2248762 RepID=UPI000E288F25|nr:DUF5602 domain-containing protein [Lewinella sp. IMCC34183]